MDKNQLRKYMKIVRQTLNMEDLSDKIVKNIQNFSFYQNAKNVMIYYPLKNEIDLRLLLKDDKNFYLPKIIDNNLAVCPYKSGDKLTESEYKTQEPVTESVSPNIIDFVVVPGVCADYSKNRIGYGKGFYDKFLKQINAFKIFALPECCVINNIPTEEFDVELDFLITENGIIC